MSLRHLVFLIVPLALVGASAFFWMQEDPVSYNTDIRPIFNNKCISCHGGVKQSGGFSVLFREEALRQAESGAYAIIPGDADHSELMYRINHTDPEERMPAEQEALSKEEIDVIHKWIDEGATWETHWAYIRPNTSLEIPNTGDRWVQNGIDGFILENLEDVGLEPAPRATREKLIRRLSLDLIGLPPTLEEIEDFVADASDDAYERVVDRLLASPRFGERWASMWMDLARYGDSQGYQKDPRRTVWTYRDWVIRALNEDMPFDQFTTEQLAGDLLPNPTQDQILATAYHRNTMSNDEGGTDDEEFRVAAVLDRVNTTFEVWQGTTMSCVQCHSHPYDPFLHEEYYGIYAFFNNTADADKPNEKPVLRAYSPIQLEEVAANLDWFEQTCTLNPIESAQPESPETLVARYDRIASHLRETDAACLVSQFEDWRQHLQKFRALAPPRTPVMQELPPDSSRVTRLFERGNWLVHGDTMQPAVPASLAPMDDALPKNRLGLAQWLVADDNPLTARVIVNRFWEQLFGAGIVTTLNDFGSQGAPPTHPELLDWLALQFQFEYDWHVKDLLKLIVTSATYQQDNAVTPELLEKDPSNQWLARGPRFRLSAEQIRDQALAVGGLLSEKMYGPGVMPPQPAGTWQIIRNSMRWEAAEDENRFRRGLYTFWRRSSPYPSMITFDTPTREYCVSQRIRTNTPLQALVVLNDTVFVEAAVGLAQRMKTEAGPDVQAQLNHGMHLALAHPPTDAQQTTLNTFYQNTLAHYEANSDQVHVLVPDTLEQAPNMAALINSANVILNLDEFLNKP